MSEEIIYKKIEETLVASARFVLKERGELPGMIDSVRRQIPEAAIAGAPIVTLWFVSNATEGYAAELGFPVKQPVDADGIETKTIPPLEVLSLVHKGSMENLRESYGTLYGYTNAHSLISDEFTREVYHELSDPGDVRIELQFVIHNWHRLLSENVERALGDQARDEVVQEGGELILDWGADDRFQWVVGAMDRLSRLTTDERQRYDIVSRCAHVFPRNLIDDLREVYQAARVESRDGLEAIDALIAYMDSQRAWGSIPTREGHVLTWVKAPRDRQGYENAETDLERRKAYCFCPLIRNHMDQEIPATFCNCSSGWFRQQIEGAIDQPVHIEITESLLMGHDRCQFVIYLPDNL
jgi:effector-binding domain-containing protein